VKPATTKGDEVGVMDIRNERRKVVCGKALVAGDEGFDVARRPGNLAVEQPVRAMVEVVDATGTGGARRQCLHAADPGRLRTLKRPRPLGTFRSDFPVLG
jgi:hypothetical protein